MPPPPASRRSLVVAALVLVVAVTAAVLAALSVRSISSASARSSVSDEALSAARQIAVDFAAYDYRHLADDFKRVADESVGSFHEQFLSSSSGVESVIVKTRSVSTAEVASAAVVRSNPARAVVVIALNRTISNKSLDKPAHDSIGLQLTLVHQRGRWFASDLETA